MKLTPMGDQAVVMCRRECTEGLEMREVVELALVLHPDRCTPPDGRRMAAWCTWCDVLEPFREPA